MTVFDFHSEPISDDCLSVLSSYAIRDAAAKASNPEYSGWLDRVDEVVGVDKVRLTGIHGFLIAQGMLKFEITGRSVGLQYQLSPLGRESLNRRARGEEASAHDDHSVAEVTETEEDSLREAA